MCLKFNNEALYHCIYGLLKAAICAILSPIKQTRAHTFACPETIVKILPITLTVALVCLSYESARADEDSAEPVTPSETQPKNAAPGVVIIEGDSMQIHLDRQLKSIGHAEFHRDNQDIYGDTIEYDVQNQELHVLGNVRINNNGNTVSGPELRLRVDENIGEMKSPVFQLNSQLSRAPKSGSAGTTDNISNNYLTPTGTSDGTNPQLSTQNIEDSSTAPQLKRQTGPSRGDASTMLFEGQDKKQLKSARYTTCSADSDDWYIKASDMELNDYTQTATAKNARIVFKGVPILYTPWISFSYLNQRQTGFLTPTFGTTTRSGFELAVPFYWNISPNLDATLTTRALSKRGVQFAGETRYLGETYSGIDNLEYLPNDNQADRTRYFVNLKHKQTFSNGLSFSYDLEKVSDKQYFSDLTTGIITTSKVNLPQNVTVGYGYGAWSFSAVAQKYQTLDGVSYPYELLPQLNLNANKDWNIANINFNSQFVRFDRDSNAPLSSATASGGLLTTSVTGNRLSAYPSVSLPLARPYGYITPKLGINYTSYQLDNPAFTLNGVSGEYASDSRTLPIFSVDSGLYFDRTMRVVNRYYTQTLEPRLYYVYIPNSNQSKFPVFDSAEADLNLGTLFLENQFVGGDRINNANQVSLAVTSRMIDAKTGEQRLAATLGQRFYFTDQKVALPGEALRTGNSSDIVAAATARLLSKWNVDTAWQYNTDTARTVKANIGTRYSPEPGKVLNLSYRYTKESLEQINISGQWPLTRGWYGVGRYNYSLKESQLIEAIAGLEYDAGCWQARAVMQRVSTATANANTALFFQLELGGVASVGSSPLNLLKRSVPGYTSSGLIPDSYQQQLNE